MIMNAVGFGEAPRVVTQYMALFHNILHRMRFAKFLAIVSEELDKEVGFLILDWSFIVYVFCWKMEFD